ncbi:hypothetical protein BDBG_17530, partial [Blastomyces gilchristii SLH14081]
QQNLLSLNLLSQNLLKILRKLRRILLRSLFIEKKRKKYKKRKTFKSPEIKDLFSKFQIREILQKNKVNFNLIFRIRNEINQQFFSQLISDIK